MADNLAYTPGSGATVAADDIGGVHHQLMKVEWGSADTANQTDVLLPLPVQPGRIAAATLANVAFSATTVTLTASNTARRGLTLFNDVDRSCYVKFGATASATDFVVKMAPGAFYEMPGPIYTGVVDALWDSGGTGSMRVTIF